MSSLIEKCLSLFANFLCKCFAGVAQSIEHQPSKLRVAGLSPVSRSFFQCCYSSVVEHFLGKEEVSSSNLDNSSEKNYYSLV